MEVVRKRRDAGPRQSCASTLASSASDDLAPPPAPFPIDLVARHQQASTSTQVAPEADQTAVDWHGLQSSCVQVLTALLPDPSPSSSNTTPSTEALPLKEAQLASAITDLLQVSYELETLRPLTAEATGDGHTDRGNGTGETNGRREDAGCPLEDLRDEVEGMLAAASARASSVAGAKGRDIEGVRKGIAWERTVVLCQAILQLLKSRQGGERQSSDGNGVDDDLPPGYEANVQPPPSYHLEKGRAALSTALQSESKEMEQLESKPDERLHNRPTMATSEKMQRDFDDMTAVIQRLHPRLQDQRSELRPSKARDLAEIQRRMERDKMRELEEIWRLIERTHGKRREVGDQRVDAEEIEARRAARRKRFFETLLDNGENSRLNDQDSPMHSVDANLARARDLKERDRFLQQLVDKSDGGRMDNQDAQDCESAKQTFIDSVVAFSSNGRLRGQDCAPVTPKITNTPTRDPLELVTVEDFIQSYPESLASNSCPLDSEKNKTGTLRKIAGMVSRSSLGLGLKPTNDFSSATFVAEHQENLSLVQVMLHGVGAGVKEDLVIETDRSSCDGVDKATIVSRRDPSVSMRVTLPCAALAGQSVAFTPMDLHLEAKLGAMPTASSNAAVTLALPSHALSAQDLCKLKPRALCCTQCDREVADLSQALEEEQRCQGSGFKNLPSEHWAEMMEVWMCHDDPAFTAQLAKRTEEGFWPTKSTVLVGGSYLLVAGDGDKQANLQVKSANGYKKVDAIHQLAVMIQPSLEPLVHFQKLFARFWNGQSDGWVELKCACGEVLGKKRSDEATFGRGTLRLSKWSVALLREDKAGETVEPVRFPLSVFIMSDILEMAQAHATYRFVLADEQSGSVRALLWLFNPSVGISYQQSEHGLVPSPLRRSSVPDCFAFLPASKTCKAAKILYKIVEGGSASDRPFGPAVQAETIWYPANVCSSLISALKESTALFPVARRSMGGYTAGFLERQ